MMIKKGLPKFQKETSLIVVSGTNDARLLIAKDGEINEVEYIKANKPDYSDKEGHFKVRTSGKTIRSGAVYEDKVHIVKQEYYKLLQPKLKSYTGKHDFNNIYLFCPQPINEEITKNFPSNVRNKITLVETGNFKRLHPLKLLEKIHKLEMGPKVLKNYNPEAKHILDKFKNIGTYLRQRLS